MLSRTGKRSKSGSACFRKPDPTPFIKGLLQFIKT
jgi:hypothetical protein